MGSPEKRIFNNSKTSIDTFKIIFFTLFRLDYRVILSFPPNFKESLKIPNLAQSDAQ